MYRIKLFTDYIKYRYRKLPSGTTEQEDWFQFGIGELNFCTYPKSVSQTFPFILNGKLQLQVTDTFKCAKNIDS
jgi:hypothetical protein